MNYTYVDIKKESHSIEIENNDYAAQAIKDFEISKKYIQAQEYFIWRYALKAYHLSRYDRKQGLKKWQHNITIGLIRSFIDVLISTVQEKPLTFIGTGINEAGVKNKDNIIKALNYISDVTLFHTTIKKTLANGLIFGEICLKVGYDNGLTPNEVISIVNGEAKKSVEVLNDDHKANYPYATMIPIFDIFPDPYSGFLRNVTERKVIPYREFIKIFGAEIRSPKNVSPLKSEDFLKNLPLNRNNADFTDYGNITNQVHQKINEELSKKDKYLDANQTGNNSLSNAQGTTYTADQDTQVTDGLIEVLRTVYEDRIVIHANRYPVCFPKDGENNNEMGFINYVIQSANESNARFGEGVAYLLMGLEEVGNNFINNYFDGARSLANPTFVTTKGLFINDDQITNAPPGGMLYSETPVGEKDIFRLDKGGLNDFNIMNIIQQIARQITGISEYTLGEAAGERTTTGALAGTQSSNRRMSPYLSIFAGAMSVVAQMWLSLIKQHWTEAEWIYILDEDGKQMESTLSNKDLLGAVNISLQAEGLFGSTNELELQKLIEVYRELAPSGFFKSPELAKEIIKKSGFVPSRFIVETEQLKPDNAEQIAAGNAMKSNVPQGGDEALIAQMATEANSSQVNRGNGGEGQ